jgi:hypothetical protein
MSMKMNHLLCKVGEIGWMLLLSFANSYSNIYNGIYNGNVLY